VGARTARLDAPLQSGRPYAVSWPGDVVLLYPGGEHHRVVPHQPDGDVT
jgi:hypothetical protein